MKLVIDHHLFHQIVIKNSLLKTQSRFTETSSHLALAARLRVVRPRPISRAWIFNNTHLQSGSPHTAAYTWASHLPTQLWHPFWPHRLETKRSVEFWVMAKWVTVVTLYPSAPPTYLHLFTTHTEDTTHINVFQPTHSPPTHLSSAHTQSTSCSRNVLRLPWLLLKCLPVSQMSVALHSKSIPS